jgi:putative DNA primase/helicase
LKGDVSDFLGAGGTIDQLRDLAKAAPEWEPAAETADAGSPISTGSGSGAGTVRSTAAVGKPEFDGAPRPVTVELLPVPILDPAMLPVPFRGWLADGAERMGAPLDYSAVAALVAVASVVGRRLHIRPKRHDDWTVCPNVWGAAVGPPSVLKTACIREALGPVYRLESEARGAHAEATATYIEDGMITKAKSDAAKERLKKAARSDTPSESELRQLAKEAALAESLEPPPGRRYIVNDATVEKLGELLAQNPNGLLQFRDELAGFFRSLDKQGHESDRGFYLEAWNGFGCYTYDRIGFYNCRSGCEPLRLS